MKFSWLICVLLLAVCMICEVVGDYSEPLVPSKELRNRVHRTTRMNMRMGKRYGDEYDDEVPKRGLRMLIRTGKRSDPQLSANTQHTLDTFLPLDTVDFQEPKGKRNYNNLERVRFYSEPQRESEDILPDAIVAPKRKLRMIMRTGKRNTQPTLDTPSEQFDTYSDDQSSEDFLLSPEYKRSSAHFLLNPRVGKNDKTWTVQALSKRGDPKAADMWFGPRIGRSSIDQLEEFPWSYVIFNNGNRLSSVLKSNEIEEQSKDNGSD